MSSKYLYGTMVMAASLAAGAQAAEESSALVSTALQFLSRASSTSEVLTLNLTNLLILVVLKAIIFGFGLFSVGGTGRSADEAVPTIQQSDLTGGMCFMMYTAGDEEKLNCVQRSACEDPKTATDYLTAAKMWYKIHKLMKVVPFASKYYDVMSAVQDATEHSLNGGECSVYRW
jgi:hypothetical protein